MRGDEALIGAALGFGFEIGGNNVEGRIEMAGDPQRRQGVFRMHRVAIGEDMLAAGQCGNRRAQFRMRIENRVVDVVNIGDVIPVKCLGIDKQGRIKLSKKAAEQDAAASAD